MVLIDLTELNNLQFKFIDNNELIILLKEKKQDFDKYYISNDAEKTINYIDIYYLNQIKKHKFILLTILDKQYIIMENDYHLGTNLNYVFTHYIMHDFINWLRIEKLKTIIN